MVRILFSLFITMIIFGCQSSEKDFQFENGDLLFSVGKGESGLLKAIQNATSRTNEIPFSHVGIVFIEGDSVFIVETSPANGVVKTPLADFINEAAVIDDKPLIAVGRVRKEFRASAEKAPSIAVSHLGKKYDFEYDETDDSFYCSELIRFSYLDSSGSPIFPALAMSFKNKETGNPEPFWVEHFQKLNKEIPEGKPGSNPADMAKSEVLEMVHFFYR